MNKKTQQGFSLAEILIALGIISIVATMGFSISKKGIERAYNQYYHTGYVGIQTALASAQREEKTSTLGTLRKYIGEDLFRGEVTPDYVIIAPNNIKYTITGSGRFKIKMTVPGANGPKDVDLYYLPDEYNFLIIGGTYQNRIDLLPFYIDDGKAGRLIRRYTEDAGFSAPEYTKRKFYSFKDAFCAAYPGKEVTYSNTPIVTCTNSGSGKIGAIRIADPRKVF